jgi:hypothetical protein
MTTVDEAPLCLCKTKWRHLCPEHVPATGNPYACVRMLTAALLQTALAETPSDTSYPPTADEVNALPTNLRQWIHQLETDADPAGTIRRAVLLEQENAQLRALVVQSETELAAMRLASAETFEALLDAPPAAIKTLLGVYVDKVKETVDGFKKRLEAATHAIRQLNDERDRLLADLAEREVALKEIYEAKVNDLTWGDGDWARSRAANALGLEDRWSKK